MVIWYHLWCLTLNVSTENQTFPYTVFTAGCQISRSHRWLDQSVGSDWQAQQRSDLLSDFPCQPHLHSDFWHETRKALFFLYGLGFSTKAKLHFPIALRQGLVCYKPDNQDSCFLRRMEHLDYENVQSQLNKSEQQVKDFCLLSLLFL